MGRFSPTDVPIMEVHNRQGKAVNSRASFKSPDFNRWMWTSAMNEFCK